MENKKIMEIIEWINFGNQLIKREKLVSSMLFTLSYFADYLRERKRIQKRERFGIMMKKSLF